MCQYRCTEKEPERFKYLIAPFLFLFQSYAGREKVTVRLWFSTLIDEAKHTPLEKGKISCQNGFYS